MLAGTRATRFPVRIPIRYRPEGHDQWRDGHTENISRSGVLFTTSEPVAKLTAIEMLLTLPMEVGGGEHATVICRGRVVRTEPARETDHRSAVAATIAGFRLAHWYTNDPRRI